MRTHKCSENSRRKIRRKALSSTRSLLLTIPTAFLVLFSITLALLIYPAEGAPFFFDTLRDLLSPFRPNRFDHSIIFPLLNVFHLSHGSPLGEQTLNLWRCPDSLNRVSSDFLLEQVFFNADKTLVTPDTHTETRATPVQQGPVTSRTAHTMAEGGSSYPSYPSYPSYQTSVVHSRSVQLGSF